MKHPYLWTFDLDQGEMVGEIGTVCRKKLQWQNYIVEKTVYNQELQNKCYKAPELQNNRITIPTKLIGTVATHWNQPIMMLMKCPCSKAGAPTDFALETDAKLLYTLLQLRDPYDK